MSERVEREIPGVGLLVFEDFGPGEWLTQKGEPAKKARRRYMLDGRELDSVSSIVDTLDKPALRFWIEDQATRGAVHASRLGELQEVHEDDWLDRVKSLGLGASAKATEGADRGTVIHNAMHELATVGVAPNPAEFDPVARPWVRGAVRAWLEMAPQLVASEEMVCHPELRYAGRPDLVAVVGGARTLIDYKSGKGRVFDNAHYQTRFYEMALRALGESVERILIVGIADDGKFELIDCEVSEAQARELLGVFRSRKSVNAGMARQRREAKKLEKAA